MHHRIGAFLICLFIFILNIFLTSFVYSKEKWFRKKIAEGIEYIRIVNPDYPLSIHILEIDLYNFSLQVKPGIAWDRIGRIEVLSSLSKRNKAVGAINGTFFDRPRKMPIGYLVINGELIFKSDIRRTSMGITEIRDVIFGYFKPYIKVRIEGRENTFYIEGVNKPRSSNTIVLYTSHYGKRTNTSLSGQEIIVQKRKDGDYIKSIVDGNALIPKDGYVISFSGKSLKALEWLYEGLQIYVDFFIPSKWSDVQHLITGGPLLVKEGKVAVKSREECFSGGICGVNPRTAVGVTKDNKLLMVVVDGRSKASRGLNFRELANLLLKLGAKEAMGLDSGGSSEMVINNVVINNPSDKCERPISNGLLILKQENN